MTTKLECRRISTVNAPGHPSARLRGAEWDYRRPPGANARSLPPYRGHGWPLADRRRYESRVWRGEVVAVSPKFPTSPRKGDTAGPTRADVSPPGPPCPRRGVGRVPWRETPGWSCSSEPSAVPPAGGVPRVIAFFTDGNDLVLRQHESQSPS